jgi:hypothetical protein
VKAGWLVIRFTSIRHFFHYIRTKRDEEEYGPVQSKKPHKRALSCMSNGPTCAAGWYRLFFTFVNFFTKMKRKRGGNKERVYFEARVLRFFQTFF